LDELGLRLGQRVCPSVQDPVPIHRLDVFGLLVTGGIGFSMAIRVFYQGAILGFLRIYMDKELS
jgi:hypothetical protein